jgi:signal transduction histidine kinase
MRLTVKGGGVVLALALLTLSMGLYAESKDEAIAMAKKAAAYYKQHGKVKLIDAAQKEKGQFEKGELYIYILDFNGTILAHPKFPSWVGRSFLNLRDADGRLFIKDAVEQLKTKDDCWIEYKWNHPVTKKIRPKICYFLKADDLIIACGIWQ